MPIRVQPTEVKSSDSKPLISRASSNNNVNDGNDIELEDADKNAALPKWHDDIEGSTDSLPAKTTSSLDSNKDFITAIDSNGKITKTALENVPAVQEPRFPTQLIPLNTQPLVIDESLRQNKPLYPALYYIKPDSNIIYSLPVSDCTVIAHLHVSTAVVHINIVYMNTSNEVVDPIFLLPTRGTVSNASININNSRFFETSVVSNDDLAHLPKKDMSSGSTNIFGSKYEEYVHNLFRLPITGVKPGESVYVAVDYIEPLEFFNNRYHLNVSLLFDPHVLPANRALSDILRIFAYVNTPIAVNDAGIQSETHVVNLTNYGSRWDCAIKVENVAVNFNLSYYIHSQQILGTCIKETSSLDPVTHVEKGHFVCFVSPPSVESLEHFFGRTFMFILDRSGSMTGKPWDEAVKSLRASLSVLRASDMFSVIVFDHEFSIWNSSLQTASSPNIQLAMNWVELNSPRQGLTNINDPLAYTIDLLNKSKGNVGNEIPFIFLLTDGAVEDERTICDYAIKNHGIVRINTVGLGNFCNQYFLRMLAESTRGHSETVLDETEIVLKTSRMMANSATPVLTNLKLNIGNVDNVELFPWPLTDLYANTPLMMSGSYTVKDNTFPAKIELSGNNSQGQMISIPIWTTVNPSIPVNKVFIKQRLEILTARQWLSQSKMLQAEIVSISTSESMPSPFTSMIAYEVKAPDAQVDPKALKKADRDRKLKLAGAAVGGVVVLGAAVYLFGNLAATATGGLALVSDLHVCCACIPSNCDCCSCLHSVSGGLFECVKHVWNCVDCGCFCRSICCVVQCIFSGC